MKYAEVKNFINTKTDARKNTVLGYESDIRLILDEINSIKKINEEKKLLKLLDGSNSLNTTFIEDLFLNKLTNKYKKSSINKKITSMNLFINYLIGKSIIAETPMGNIKKFDLDRKKSELDREIELENLEADYFQNADCIDEEERIITEGKKILSADEVKKLIYSIESNKYDLYYRNEDFLSKRDKFLIALMFCTGLRISEALNIKLTDIKKVENGCMINVIEHKTSKKIGAKRVPLANKCFEYFEDYLEERKKLKTIVDKDYLFLSYTGRKQIASKSETQNNYKKIVREFITKQNTTIHCLRYSFRNTMTGNNVTNELILLIGGWTRKGMGKVYTQDSIKYDQAKIKASNIL